MPEAENEFAVTVVVPVYNSEKYLEEALSCLVRQTLKNIELLCIDDGSSDGSGAILDDWANRYRQIRVIHRSNAGAGAARNFGLDLSRGEYVSFLDADDIFEPNMLATAYKTAKNSDADLVIFGADFYYSDRKVFEKAPWLSLDRLPANQTFDVYDIAYPNVFRSTNGWAWDKLFKRSFLLDNNIRFQEQRTYNDMTFTFSALFAASKIRTIDKTLIHQRKNHGSSLSQTSDASWPCVRDALVKLRSELERLNLYQTYEQDFKNYVLHMLQFSLSSVSHSRAILKMYPTLREQWINEFELAEIKDESFFYNESDREWLEYVLSNDVDAYLYDELSKANERAEAFKNKLKALEANNAFEPYSRDSINISEGNRPIDGLTNLARRFARHLLSS